MIVIGIDPGQRGAIALHSGAALSAVVMPSSIQEFHAVMKNFVFESRPESVEVFIEKAQSMPKQGIASAFNYGRHFGELLGCLVALGIRHSLVPPASWARQMHVGAVAGSAKERSLEVVRRLCPDLPLTVGPRAKKPHDGIIDAALICLWGRRQLGVEK